MPADAMLAERPLVDELAERFAALDPLGRLQALRGAVDGTIVFTTSFGLEDQALAHLILTNDFAIDVVTLDTGRLFPETYAVWAETEERYGRRIRAVYPQARPLETLIADQGINGFYRSVDARKACCDVRKVEPLKRALSGAAGWVTGVRADQSNHRGGLRFVSWDAQHQLVKANPLFDWSRDAVAQFVAAEQVPVNSLHAQGFPSIGCAPCTRAVEPGEPERAGRWWWEDETKKECGLHVGPDGRLVRVVAAPVGEIAS